MKPQSIYRRTLPHWRLDGAIYFVTWCLDASQPLLRSEERSLVKAALFFAEGKSFELWAYVVMDDHVHALVQPKLALERVIHSWKSFTAHELVKKPPHARRAPVWRTEYYDRIVRDAEDLEQKTGYILGNPQRRWPKLTCYEWVGARGLSGTW